MHDDKGVLGGFRMMQGLPCETPKDKLQEKGLAEFQYMACICQYFLEPTRLNMYKTELPLHHMISHALTSMLVMLRMVLSPSVSHKALVSALRNRMTANFER